LRGATVVGSPEEVAAKILYQHELFRHDRFLIQFTVGSLPHDKTLKAIELFGTEVAPAVREEVSRRASAARASGAAPST
jgi:alkanesulfonate monooxygenase SsuD/methylene tetrahydromethanopterin reductase-like flavin-dependent oxidoreductase (luciferase family)